jgi:tRNA 2-selenouridine synthase
MAARPREHHRHYRVHSIAVNAKTREAQTVSIEQAIARFDEYHDILDARSPAEHALDHLPGAISAPVLDDAQRIRVGTLYKQTGAFEAKRLGAALVSRNIADLLEGPLADRPRDWRPLVYCWRGGNRSGALATVMARIGWRVDVLEGGYRAFRRQVIADLEAWPAQRRFLVVAGRTGSGKSLLLEQLAVLGAQVLDLEALARHRGSVLGHLPDAAQPSQKHFESLVWDVLRRSDPARPIFVESESRKVGQCQVPQALIEAIRGSCGVCVQAPDTVRSELLMRDYRHFIDEPARLIARLQALVTHHGHARIGEWTAMAQDGRWPELVQSLLADHYDPAYLASMARNFSQLASFAQIDLRGAQPDDLLQAARQTLAATTSLATTAPLAAAASPAATAAQTPGGAD